MAPLLDRYLTETLKNTPLVYYRMREGTGTTMTDSSSNANNGTYSGSGINWVSSGTGNASTGYARPNGRDAPLWNSHHNSVDSSVSPIVVTNSYNAYFDGAAGNATDTLNSPAINTSAASKVTVEMWIRWDGVLAGGNGTFEALANFAGATGLLLGFLKNGAADYRFGISIRNTGDLWGLSNANTLALLTKDVYHHIVYVITNNAIQTTKLYIDGVQATMTQQIGTTTTTESVTSAFALAYDGTASFFGGSIGEVAVYNGEVYSAAAVKNRFHMGAYGGEYQEVATLPGIEAQIELLGDAFNNPVVLNDKNVTGPGNRTRTLNQYYIREIGGLDDPDVRFAEESNFYRDGMNPLISRLGGRTLTFDGYIEASNFQSMRQLQSRLKRALVAGNTPAGGIVETFIAFRNVWDNGFDFIVQARKNSPLQIKEAQTSSMPRRDFLITARSSYPFFESCGSRTEVLQMGATVMMPHKGSGISHPLITFWGPFTESKLTIGTNTAIITGTVSASSFVTLDCKNKTCSDWTKFNTTGDFPYLNAVVLSDSLQNFAQFVSIAGGTPGVTRVEITWKHSMI